MKAIEQEIREELFALQDEKYLAMQRMIIPNIDPESIIGVRIPLVRELVKKYKKDERVNEYLDSLPHQYYDENNVHGFLVSEIKDFDECIRRLDEFLPYVDNWATCDGMRPKVFKKHKKELVPYLYKWMESNETYRIRFAIEMFMSFYLDEDFDVEYPMRIVKIRSTEYYVNMMIAWYCATALAKQWEAVIPLLETQSMDAWTHNKTIQKARESYRITPEQKEYLNSLKIK